MHILVDLYMHNLTCYRSRFFEEKNADGTN